MTFLNGHIEEKAANEPLAISPQARVELSQAISLKRIADSLEDIARSLRVGTGDGK